MIPQIISGKCFTRVLNEYKQQYKWRGKLTDADLFSTKKQRQRQLVDEQLVNEQLLNDQLLNKQWLNEQLVNEQLVNEQSGGLTEISLPDIKLKYKNNYTNIIKATYYDTTNSWELRLRDLNGDMVTIIIKDNETYDVMFDENISCNSGGNIRRKLKNKGTKRRRHKSIRRRRNKSRRQRN